MALLTCRRGRRVRNAAPCRAGPDARAEAAERVMPGKLNDLMAAGAWRREGLTIGALAGELGEPEHRLRRLINRRLGHRNFADFVNGYRIEAAKPRLGDPAEARTTVAAIAFDLGYGSLGPFNRAFRAATGATPDRMATPGPGSLAGIARSRLISELARLFRPRRDRAGPSGHPWRRERRRGDPECRPS